MHSSVTAPAQGSGAAPSTGSALMFVLRLRALIVLLLVAATFAVLSPAFLRLSNLVILAKQVAINAILGIGMTFVIIAGGIDLSVGSIVGLTGMVVGGLLYEGLVLPMLGVTVFFNAKIVALLGLLVGVFAGTLNGVIVTRLRVPPFIATLGMLYVARAAAMLRSSGATFPNLVGDPALGNTGFPVLGQEALLGVPYPVWIMAVLGLVAAYVAGRTPFGRHVYAVGGNERAAELAGIRTSRVKLMTYVISGFCSAVVGLITTSQLVAAHPMTGQMFELNAIAAVVLGGASLQGGIGSIGGTIIGAFVIGVLSNGLVLLGVSEFWQMAVKGIVIIVAVVIDQLQRSLQERVLLQQKG